MGHLHAVLGTNLRSRLYCRRSSSSLDIVLQQYRASNDERTKQLRTGSLHMKLYSQIMVEFKEKKPNTVNSRVTAAQPPRAPHVECLLARRSIGCNPVNNADELFCRATSSNFGGSNARGDCAQDHLM